jgi:uncharacterized protein (DUF362 family)
MHPAQGARVIIRHCESYDVETIRKIVREGMEELGLRPHGRTLLKPNVVAAGELFEHAHTRVEFTEGVLRALQDRNDGAMTELAVGERCAITIPTRFAFKEAKYDPMLERLGVKRYCFDEVPQVEIPLTHEGRLRDYIFTPEPIAKTDFFVNCPKLKAHPWTTVTFSMKNYIGIQDDRHRLIDHDHALNKKVADLQYIIQPQFIAIDAIIAGESRMLTPIPRKLDLIVMGNNQVAFDAVCCRIIGVDPMEVEHIRLAYERGFGPVEPEKITLSGDVTLDVAKQRAKGFKVGLVRVEKYFEGSNIQGYAGPPPGHDKDGYCWGGCPGVMEEVIEVLRLYDAQCDKKMPKIHLVFGDYKGPLDVSYGEKVVFIGDCVQWEGKLHGKLVQIRSTYQDRTTLDPYKAKHKDVYGRMIRMAKKLREAKDSPYIRLEGCPVSIGELILLLAELGNIQNPYFDRRQAMGFNKAYIAWRAVSAYKRVLGQPYQIKGPTHRGAARPEVTPKSTRLQSSPDNPRR